MWHLVGAREDVCVMEQSGFEEKKRRGKNANLFETGFLMKDIKKGEKSAFWWQPIRFGD
jgi:hypothetical protein